MKNKFTFLLHFKSQWAVLVFFTFIFSLSSFGRSLGFNFKAADHLEESAAELKIRVFNDVTGNDITQESKIVVTPTINGLQSVEVKAEGYTDTFIIGLPQAGVLTVFLVPQLTMNSIPVLDGQLTDWEYPKKSKNLQAGALFKTLSGFDLFNINQESFLSPLMDSIDVFGKRDVPSNIVLPEQTLQVFPLSVKINKPRYRLPIKSIYPTSLTAVQLTIPGSELAKLATGGGTIGLNILNKGTLTAVGYSKDFLPERNETVSFAAIHKLSPRFKVKIDKPSFATDVLVASLMDLHGQREVMIPADLKTVEIDKNGKTSEVSLFSPTEEIGHSREVMALALSEKGIKASGVVVDTRLFSQMSAGFLPVKNLPTVAPLPASIEVSPVENGFTVLTLEGTRTGRKKENELFAKIFILPSMGIHEVVLPVYTHDVQTYSVVDLDFGTSFNASNFDGTALMKDLRRFARTSVMVEKKKERSFFKFLKNTLRL